MLAVQSLGACKFFIIPWVSYSNLCPSEKSSISMLSFNKCPGGNCHLILIIYDRDHGLWALRKPEKGLWGRWLFLLAFHYACTITGSDVLMNIFGGRFFPVIYSCTVLAATYFFLSCSLDLLFCKVSPFYFVQPSADLEKRLFSFSLQHLFMFLKALLCSS